MCLPLRFGPSVRTYGQLACGHHHPSRQPMRKQQINYTFIFTIKKLEFEEGIGCFQTESATLHRLYFMIHLFNFAPDDRKNVSALNRTLLFKSIVHELNIYLHVTLCFIFETPLSRNPSTKAPQIYL